MIVIRNLIAYWIEGLIKPDEDSNGHSGRNLPFRGKISIDEVNNKLQRNIT